MLVGGTTKVTLTPWPARKYTDEKHILLHSDSLLTVVDPNDKVRDAYLKKIGKTLEDFKPQEQPVLLNEDEEVPSEDYIRDNDYDDDYEPRYQEV